MLAQQVTFGGDDGDGNAPEVAGGFAAISVELLLGEGQSLGAAVLVLALHGDHREAHLARPKGPREKKIVTPEARIIKL